jgi:plastocyanin
MAKRRKGQHARAQIRRWRRSRILIWAGLACLALAIGILSFFAFAGGEEEPRTRVRQAPVVSEEPRVTVDVVDNDFVPKDLTVRPGAEVVWEFKGSAAHDVTDVNGAFASGTLTRGDQFERTFNEPGTYYYYCTLHHAMQGTLVVQP